jgi:predicted NAD-dependent protein-ADP-ribosyltransferase YbiA (DUF1768 family)
MKVLLKRGLLILVPETAEETTRLGEWKAAQADHVLHLQQLRGEGMALHDLGARSDACREPIQVSSRSADPTVRLIGNFAPTPFTIDGRDYRSVESFWQGLKFPSGLERRRVAELEGPAARRAGQAVDYGATVRHEGQEVAVGTCAHWALMERACWAKFTQHAEARAALLATGRRPLQHRMRRDSRTIPGVIMAEIWMRIRMKLRQEEPEVPEEEGDEEA